MATRSVNEVTLIGNLTADPELRYTPQGTAVCSMSLATNREWVTDTGEKKSDAEYHRLVAWAKLAEICAQFLFKGRRVYFKGRLQTRQWETKDGDKRYTTEIVVNDMLILDNKQKDGSESNDSGGDYSDDYFASQQGAGYEEPGSNSSANSTPAKTSTKPTKSATGNAKGNDESDMPF